MPLAGSNLELVISGWGVTEPDLRRFFGVFTIVWDKIGTQDRDRECIERHWHAQSQLAKLELQLPWRGDRDAIATTKGPGAEIRFDWETCRILPDDIMQVPIAHEMGHVYQWAMGKNRSNMTPADLHGVIELCPLPRKRNTLVEIHADEMVALRVF
jgi:hypothetical protein